MNGKDVAPDMETMVDGAQSSEYSLEQRPHFIIGLYLRIQPTRSL